MEIDFTLDDGDIAKIMIALEFIIKALEDVHFYDVDDADDPEPYRKILKRFELISNETFGDA